MRYFFVRVKIEFRCMYLMNMKNIQIVGNDAKYRDAFVECLKRGANSVDSEGVISVGGIKIRVFNQNSKPMARIDAIVACANVEKHATNSNIKPILDKLGYEVPIAFIGNNDKFIAHNNGFSDDYPADYFKVSVSNNFNIMQAIRFLLDAICETCDPIPKSSETTTYEHRDGYVIMTTTIVKVLKEV
jgi:hypothetical protein